MYLCPNNNYKQEATQDCFDRHPLFVAGTKEVSYVIPEDGKKKAIFRWVKKTSKEIVRFYKNLLV